MSEGPESIVCRRCEEAIPAGADDCPHCGKSRQGRAPWLAISLGTILFFPSLLRIGDLWLFAVLGILLIGIGGFLIRGERQRKKQAAEQTTTRNPDT